VCVWCVCVCEYVRARVSFFLFFFFFLWEENKKSVFFGFEFLQIFTHKNSIVFF